MEENPGEQSSEESNVVILIRIQSYLMSPQVVPDKVKLQQLSKAMYNDDKEEAKREFSKILVSMSPDVVSFLKSLIYFWLLLIVLTKVSSTAVDGYGSVLRDAVLEASTKTDFIRLLLEHG